MVRDASRQRGCCLTEGRPFPTHCSLPVILICVHCVCVPIVFNPTVLLLYDLSFRKSIPTGSSSRQLQQIPFSVSSGLRQQLDLNILLAGNTHKGSGLRNARISVSSSDDRPSASI